jgi:hypothetical protein
VNDNPLLDLLIAIFRPSRSSRLVELSRSISDQALGVFTEVAFELGYNELHDAGRWGENSLLAARTMNVECLGTQRAGRNTGDAGR